MTDRSVSQVKERGAGIAHTRLALGEIEAELLDGRTKGIPGDVTSFPLGDIGTKGWNVLDEDLPLPLVVLKRSNLEHNIEVMQQYCRRQRVELSPHGKTTMAPQIFDLQLAAGAWGMTAASVEQLHVYRHFGVSRIVYANQLVGAPNIAYVCSELAKDPSFELYTFVDSAATAQVLIDGARQHRLDRPFTVLIEVGYEGGRSGARHRDEVEQICRVIARHPAHLELAGVAGFEGLLQVARHLQEGEKVSGVTIESHFDDMVQTVEDLMARNSLGDRFIVTAGGSAAFDKVVKAFSDRWRGRATVVLRSGCYVTHDHLMYAESPLQAPPGDDRSGAWLRPALELWGYIHSTPEDGLSLLTFGRRDVGSDYGLPVPLGHWPAGARSEEPATEWSIDQLNDQHAYLRHPPGAGVKVGDRLRCGISHPCTTFDKWKVIPEVDDAYNVVGAIKTFF